jgi:hypothetical protein
VFVNITLGALFTLVRRSGAVDERCLRAGGCLGTGAHTVNDVMTCGSIP